MKYQLVLQLPVSTIRDYDAIVLLEEAIIESLGNLGEVDGHDAGSGEMNIFVLTDLPDAAFQQIKGVIGAAGFLPSLRAAYREIGAAAFVVLHPPGL